MTTAETLVYESYFADPFVIRHEGAYYAFGTTLDTSGDRVFEILTSADLSSWASQGAALERPDPALGDTFWAPEVAYADGRWWMYYSVGHDIIGHHIRVAGSVSPLGPYEDLGVVLTPEESFAIDPHPFQDLDGRWHLFYARDVLDAERAGTHLAVAPLGGDMTSLGGPAVSVLEPYADWQIYERDREMYGRTYDWHTLEGPAVVHTEGRYWLTYSAGNWTNESYRVSWAVADSPLGPWTPAPEEAPPLLSTTGDLIGPGHNSLVEAPDGHLRIVFHAWDAARTRREMHILPIEFGGRFPHVGQDPVPPSLA